MELPNLSTLKKFAASHAREHAVFYGQAAKVMGAMLMAEAMLYVASVLPLSQTYPGTMLAAATAMVTTVGIMLAHDELARLQGPAKNDELWAAPVYATLDFVDEKIAPHIFRALSEEKQKNKSKNEGDNRHERLKDGWTGAEAARLNESDNLESSLRK